jgi:hypothetical protein
MAKIPVHIWGNHHCLDSEKFVETSQKLITKQKRFSEPQFNLKVDQCLSHKFIKTLKRFILNSKDKPQVHVIILGNVELRSGKPINEVTQRFDRLIELSSISSNVYFVVSALVPEESEEIRNLKDNCSTVNETLHQTFSKHDHITFVSVDLKLEPDDFNTSNELSHSGSTRLAQMLAKAVYCIPKNRIQWSK